MKNVASDQDLHCLLLIGISIKQRLNPVSVGNGPVQRVKVEEPTWQKCVIKCDREKLLRSYFKGFEAKNSHLIGGNGRLG